MLKIMKDRWNKNSDKLRAELAERTGLNGCDYTDLVKLTFGTIFNTDESEYGNNLDLDHITVIDNGDYQGTILFAIPFETYQPSEYRYLMTYIGYGSCSYCDALQGAQNWPEEKLTDSQIPDFMAICKDLICNCVKPYNCGWRQEPDYEQVEEDAV